MNCNYTTTLWCRLTNASMDEFYVDELCMYLTLILVQDIFAINRISLSSVFQVTVNKKVGIPYFRRQYKIQEFPAYWATVKT